MILTASTLTRRCGALATLLPFLIGWCLPVFAQTAHDKDTLTVGYLDAPPVTFQSEEGRAEGIFIELTRRVAEEAGYDLEFRLLPISRTYHYLRTGGIDVWPGATDIPALKGEVLESFVSPYSFQLSAWGLESTPPVSHFDDLTGQTVILISGYTHSGLASALDASDEVTVIYARDHRAGVAMLKRGRGDYLLNFQQAVRAVLEEFPVPGIREYRVLARNAAWVFSLANPRSAQLRDEFDSAYLSLAERSEVPPRRPLTEEFVLPGLPAPGPD